MENIMVDIETMGKKPGCAILSIGAVCFDLKTGKTGSEYYKSISLESCFELGLHVDPSTVLWWMKQSDEARKTIHSPVYTEDIKTVLESFAQWIDLHSYNTSLWGNSNRFDLGIIAAAYDKCGMKLPWRHQLERDVRTLVSFNPEIKLNEKFVGIKHQPIDDCKHQIKYCTKIYKSLIK